MLRVLTAATLALTATCALAQPAALEIVRDAQPQATIVIAPDASAQLSDAADMLASYIEQSTGAALPIAQ